jgi:hypothetical protein
MQNILFQLFFSSAPTHTGFKLVIFNQPSAAFHESFHVEYL